MRPHAVLLGSLLFLAPRAARAEWEVGTFIGVHRFSPSNRLARYPVDPTDTSFGIAPLIGLRSGYVLSPRFVLEARVAAAPTSTSDSRATITVVQGGVHGVFNILTGRLRPFVLAGIGAELAQPSDPMYLRRDLRPSGDLGVGLRFDLTRDFGLRADLTSFTVPDVRTTGFTFDLAATLGFYGRFPWQKVADVTDHDGDGIADKDDECPSEPGLPRDGGCPRKRSTQAAPGSAPPGAPGAAPPSSAPPGSGPPGAAGPRPSAGAPPEVPTPGPASTAPTAPPANEGESK